MLLILKGLVGLDRRIDCISVLDLFLLHVNELLIRNESEQQGGSLTDKAEELLTREWQHQPGCGGSHFISLLMFVCLFVCLFLTDSAKQAQEIFNGILKSKVRADTTRNALTVLQRYRFLFGLPKNIEKNIRNVS